jgi:predicted nucleotidyltransferase component of viral defense system
MALDRQDKALREFKQIMEDLVHLLRSSTRVQLTYMCWVNHSREQFVWETNSTNLPNVMFQDRVNFDHHFLNDYKEIEEITVLQVGEDIAKGKLMHYFDFVQAKTLVLVPFINKGETVAITVLESDMDIEVEKIKSEILSYNNALVNVLDTYLEVVDLHEQQKEWEVYESSLSKFSPRQHRVDILKTVINEMQNYIPTGSVSLVCHGMDTWNVVLNSERSVKPNKVGLKIEEKSVAYDALEKGEPVFSMHFNNNPKRISSGEGITEGATYAIPVVIHDRRQAVIVVSDNDPLSFKDSTKHKLSNLVRIAGLTIQASLNKSSMATDLLTHSFDAYMSELWEATVDTELMKLNSSNKTKTWFGLISPEDISSLRTKFRLEELQKIQEDFVRFLNPSLYGLAGFIGFNSDYVYSFIIQSDKEEVVEEWIEKFKTRLAHGLRLSNGHTININFKIGLTQLDQDCANSYQVLTKAKRAHSEAVNDSEAVAVVA